MVLLMDHFEKLPCGTFIFNIVGRNVPGINVVGTLRNGFCFSVINSFG